jgi:hypothetical protein
MILSTVFQAAKEELRVVMAQHSQPKIFGIGISRTGTTSLTAALRYLGYKTIHAPLSIIKRQDGKLVLNVNAVIRYEALTDSMVAYFYKALDEEFPGAKFVLTVRDVDRWLVSMQHVRRIYPLLRLSPKISLLCREAFGEGHLKDTEVMRAKFLQHTRDVVAHFEGRNDLLVMDISKGDGWDKLCNFLERPIPSVPFPHHNRQTIISWNNFRDTLRGLV